MRIVLFLLPFLFSPILAYSQNTSDWTPYGRFTDRAIAESSGFVKSRQFENVFWTHNDSGDRPRIFATTDRGELIRQITIVGAKNVDWEDIATDDAGNLYLGDIGNNDNNRRDLSVYVIDEPDPHQTNTAQISKRIHFQYPDQTLFPDPQNKNFDSEALFWANGYLYLLTKNRSDRRTALYRFESLDDTQTQTLSRLGDFEADGMVTGADASPDGSQLLVLCYEYVYLFEKPRGGDNYLAGNFKRILLELRQSEGICFDGPYFLLTNEQREIYRLPNSYFDTHDSFLPSLPSVSIPKISSFKIDGKFNEWGNLDNSVVTLNTNYLYQKKSGDCAPPKINVAWTDDGMLISMREWRFNDSKKKSDLLYVMLEINNQRTLNLQEGALVWKFSRTKESKYTLKQTTSSANGQPAIFFINESNGVHSFEAFLPISKKLSAGEQMLFNILLQPFEECECYWATDSSTWTLANPYIWGEITLGF